MPDHDNSDSAATGPSEDVGLDLDHFQRPTSDEGISLERLAEGFAELLRSGDDPYAEAADTTAVTGGGGDDYDDDESSSPCGDALTSVVGEIAPQSILEAVLFVGDPENRPLTSEHIASFMRGVRATEVDELVRELNHGYEANGCPYHIECDGPGYRLVLRAAFGPLRQKFYRKVHHARLSQAAVETLSLVGYNQPITADDVSRLRGRTSEHVLSQLVRRGLLRIERGPERPRRAKFFTTDRFLKLFGLGSLNELPRPEEMERS